MEDKRHPAKMKLQSMSELVALDLLAWVLICGVITGVFFLIDNQSTSGQLIWNPEIGRFVKESSISWAPAASIWVGLIGLTIAAAHIIYHHAKRHGRNAVAWATAFIVFSPFLSLIVYLITWPAPKTEKPMVNNHVRTSSNQVTIQPTTCPKCGVEAKENDKFCSQCGAALEEPQGEIIEAQPQFCPKCGSGIAKGDKYCRTCASKLEQKHMRFTYKLSSIHKTIKSDETIKSNFDLAHLQELLSCPTCLFEDEVARAQGEPWCDAPKLPSIVNNYCHTFRRRK